ncbi:twin-arginine translocase TatA/TatE family subunit [Candidatus Berkiella aquae]|uniref:Sec-independent protein translocase protein TatA n=1 Tax=Candidatus Berkiella aquae TaxID=295108 RepID=A0A0Q9YQG0_9GAMM|nr:twin-arginine translocase TatA/TatE family subunit [Candidatus Berkiella aquae]MCS5712644.1 twin-arginine translocase TatA/TatE family subunit [Candidatus Berkiella aquae]
MGIGGISPGSLILIFLIVVLLFGTKKLQTLGEDFGKAIKGFRKGLHGITDETNVPHTNTDKKSIEQ